jgi:hypothetical protein
MQEVIDELGYQPEEQDLWWVDKCGKHANFAEHKFYDLVLRFRKESGKKKFLFPQNYEERQRIISHMTKECGFIS